MAGGGGSSVQSAPAYVQGFHARALAGSGDANNQESVSVPISRYMNEYLDPSIDSTQSMAIRNPFGVKNPSGGMTFTIPYPDIRTTDTDDYKEYLDYFRRGGSRALEQYVTQHIANLDSLMNTEAADVMQVADRGLTQLLVDYPELGENVVESFSAITNSILNAVYAYMNDPVFDLVFDVYNDRLDLGRDRQISQFKNSMGMQDASLSSAFNTGLGLIYEEAVRKEGEYQAQISLEMFTKSFTQFLSAYLADYAWIKQMKVDIPTQLSKFVMGTFSAKLDKNSTHYAMYDAYIKLAMTGMHDYFSYVQATRIGFYQWPFEIYQMGGNFMSAGMGGNVPTQKFTKAQSAFAGAAAGAGIGTAIAPGVGTAIGAGVGLLAGLAGHQ